MRQGFSDVTDRISKRMRCAHWRIGRWRFCDCSPEQRLRHTRPYMYEAVCLLDLAVTSLALAMFASQGKRQCLIIQRVFSHSHCAQIIRRCFGNQIQRSEFHIRFAWRINSSLRFGITFDRRQIERFDEKLAPADKKAEIFSNACPSSTTSFCNDGQ